MTLDAARLLKLGATLMGSDHAFMAMGLMVFLASLGYAQAPTAQGDVDRPDFKVQVWGDVGIEFITRLDSYVELRSELENGLPPLKVSDKPAEIRRAERALARRIRIARAKAKRGDIFTPAISGLFRNALLLEMDTKTWKSIMDDNPGSFSVRINGNYPDKKPLSTVPANVLAVLPRLPDSVQYRFLGPHLVLFDARARVVLDGIPYAIRSPEER
jgi:hypothetical protein